MTNISRNVVVPLYLQIADDIKSKIESGELKPKDRIPTELKLSESYHVSRITIRKALELLVEEEILARKQKLGTFVLSKKISRNLNFFMGFTQNCEMEGNKAGARLLSAELVKATPSDIKYLDLCEDDKVIRIRRLRYCNDIPVILEDSHFPKSFAYLLAEDLNSSLHQILASHKIDLRSGTKTIGVCHATKEEAKLLQIKENDALILSKDIAYDLNGDSVYYSKEIINAERYEYKILTNSGGMKNEAN